MSNKTIAAIVGALAIGGAGLVTAQQKPVSSRTAIVVYKSPT